MAEKYLFAGMGRVTLPVAAFDLGHGVCLRQTYAHLFAPYMMAFSPAKPGLPHPAPWRAASGGSSFDVTVELCVPVSDNLPGKLSTQDTIEWIIALMRISFCPYLIVPVISDQSFSVAATSEKEPRLTPFEVHHRQFAPVEKPTALLPEEQLEWIKSSWAKSSNLLNKYPKFKTALYAVDKCSVEQQPSASLLAVWGALEQLFSSADAELKFRVSSYIAAYLEPPGQLRLDLFRKTKKLYNNRSTVAHSTSTPEIAAFVGSWVIARNALMKMINKDHVPSQIDLEELLFGVQEAPDY